MQRTTDQPTEPGWYWLWVDADAAGECVKVLKSGRVRGVGIRDTVPDGALWWPEPIDEPNFEA